MLEKNGYIRGEHYTVADDNDVKESTYEEDRQSTISELGVYDNLFEISVLNMTPDNKKAKMENMELVEPQRYSSKFSSNLVLQDLKMINCFLMMGNLKKLMF